MSTPQRAAQAARRALAKHARPAGSFDASRYFRGTSDLGFHNIGMSTVRAVARAIVADHPEWTVDDAMTFAEIMVRDRHLETKAVGIEVVARYRKAFTPRLLPAWKRWLARGDSANWATTDSICGVLIGPLLLAHPRLAGTLLPWARHRSLWVRRASIVGLIALARRGESQDLVYRIAGILHSDPHDLIHKAVGWALREAGKADSRRLEGYLRANGPSIPRTTVRYAIERFPIRRRKALLAATRGTPNT